MYPYTKEETMNNLSLITKIAKEIVANGGQMYFVGGMVRDKILGKQNKDIDVEIHDISVKETTKILSKYGNVSTVGVSFGILMLSGIDIDFAFPRNENKTGDKHTDFEVSVDPYMGLSEAAKRRDFTMNAIMQNVVTGEIIDPFNGIQALNDKHIMYVDEHTYVEDPLRSLRAAQFASRLGFTIDDRVIHIAQTLDYSHLSKERIYTELNKALMSQQPSVAFKYLKEMNVLKTVLPDMDRLPNNVFMETLNNIDKAVVYKDMVTNPLAFMYTLLFWNTPHQYKQVSNNKDNTNYINNFMAHKRHVERMTQLNDYQMRKLIVDMPINDAIMIDQILKHKSTAEISKLYSKVQYLSTNGYGKIEPVYTGKDLLDMNFTPGPKLGKLLFDLFDMQLQGHSKSDLNEYIHKYISSLR